jgi:hypothetical protein
MLIMTLGRRITCCNGWEIYLNFQKKLYSTVLVRKPEGKRSLGRLRRRWVDNIKVCIKIGYMGVDWIHLAKDRVQWTTIMNTVMNLRVS